MMTKVFAYLDHIFRMVRPRRLLYMAGPYTGTSPLFQLNMSILELIRRDNLSVYRDTQGQVELLT